MAGLLWSTDEGCCGTSVPFPVDFMLALRPSEEKNPIGSLLEVGDSGVLEEDDEELVREVIAGAREGYGSGGGPRGGLVSIDTRIARSVAEVVSARLGNVASEAMEERETCLG